MQSTPRRILPLCLLAFAPLSMDAKDIRHDPPKDLNGYFPYTPPASIAQWESRKEEVRRQILVSQGLWPMPTRGPLNAVIHGRVDCGEYTVEKVYFESAPGFFVTGNLYRPAQIKGKVPGVMFAHGHWTDARFGDTPEARLRQEIASGQERFVQGGRSPFQSMCVQLARMGCVVWQWDMLSDSDAIQFSREVVHKFAKQRPEMNTTENWGLYSPQAEAHAQSIMGLQTWNAIRGLDFLLSLPEVDPGRTAITGASGGGTQTMLLSAVDERIKLSYPVVMVSTAMQGGCTCENSSLLRVNTGNIEFAALFAPKPQGMNTANDWTKELATKGFPELQALYELYGKKDFVFLNRGEHFPHNYNAVTRSAFFTFLNKHFNLGQPSPVIEKDFEPLPREKLTVWDAAHPAPKAADPDFERGLLKWFHLDAQRQLEAAAQTAGGLRKHIAPALEVIIGRTLARVGEIRWHAVNKRDLGGHFEMDGTLENTTYAEEIPVTWLFPKNWNGRAVVWLDPKGKAGVRGPDGTLKPAVSAVLQSGALVLGADLLFQADSQNAGRNRVVSNPREFAGYTYGYNHALFAQRTHDVLSIVGFLKNSKMPDHPPVKEIQLAAWGETGPVAVAARALAREHVKKAAFETDGFRFGSLLDYAHPQFLPGGAKYLDLPGMLALGAPSATWLCGEKALPAAVRTEYQHERAEGGAVLFAGEASRKEGAAVEWLLK